MSKGHMALLSCPVSLCEGEEDDKDYGEDKGSVESYKLLELCTAPFVHKPQGSQSRREKRHFESVVCKIFAEFLKRSAVVLCIPYGEDTGQDFQIRAAQNMFFGKGRPENLNSRVV